MRQLLILFILLFVIVSNEYSLSGYADDQTSLRDRFQPIDVFELEYASDPRISPDGNQVVYVRNFMDIMKDRRRSNLWIVNVDGTEHRPLTTGNKNDSSPRWSPDGKRLAYVTDDNGTAQVFSRWMDTGQTAKLTNLTNSPIALAWSPDGSQIAFSMLVPDQQKPFVEMPAKPEGAEWADPPNVIRKVVYRFDGKGYLKHGHHQLFVLPADGGTARQITDGPFEHDEAPSWSRDGKSLVFSSNRSPNWEYEPRNSEIYEVSLKDSRVKPLTDRKGPDFSPVVSPDGRQIAYLGYDDEQLSYQITRLYVMNRDGSNKQIVTEDFDRTVAAPKWRDDGKSIFVQYDEHGSTKVASVTLSGKVTPLADSIGGTTIGRPYASGSFSVSKNGTIAYTQTNPNRPADVAIARADSTATLTSLNDDLFGHKKLGRTEEFWFESKFDEKKIHGWVVTPPGFDAKKKYPLLLEIHGGPFANYGDRFTAEVQLYAAAGYVVVYINPRGSTGYGQDFANLIHHAYPGHDFDDLMSAVDRVIDRGYIDEKNLFVTGGSGGGVLTAWVVGKTNRFRAAVAAKPVINWYSFVLTSDAYPFFNKYWFPGYPWEHTEHYIKRSPLSLVGNVTTPTMLLTGEVDHRTPISESEQFYQALKLRKIDTALVRVPGASHAIAKRPSLLIAKVAHILKWFEMYRTDR